MLSCISWALLSISFDVGGGLGVDYEVTRSQSDCSVNYGLNEYANNIIWAIGVPAKGMVYRIRR